MAIAVNLIGIAILGYLIWRFLKGFRPKISGSDRHNEDGNQ